MPLKEKILNRIFLFVMHSNNENLKEKVLRKRLNHLGKNPRIYSDQFGSEPWLLSIGDDVIVASGVSFIEHDASFYTAYRYLNEKSNPKAEKRGAIIIGDNCFIGANSTILGGTKIGNNSIIAAGAVVHGVIPEGEVWGGVPAKFIMKTSKYAKKIKQSSENLPWIVEERKLTETEDINISIISNYYMNILK